MSLAWEGCSRVVDAWNLPSFIGCQFLDCRYELVHIQLDLFIQVEYAYLPMCGEVGGGAWCFTTSRLIDFDCMIGSWPWGGTKGIDCGTIGQGSS